MVTTTAWGQLSDGREVRRITLETRSGYRLELSDYGARIVRFLVPDSDGTTRDVVLGYDTVAEYEAQDGYLGAVVGRVGNRLGGGLIRVDGHEYAISTNEGANTLHGGAVGFDQAVWTVEHSSETSVTFRHESPDGDQGFPGAVTVWVTYTLDEDGTLTLDYRATADQATPVNLTNHVYFNLDGDGRSVAGHTVHLEADYYTPVDDAQLPDGTIRSVEGTAMDFRSGKSVAEALDADDPQIEGAGGVDHNFVLRKEEAGELTLAATVAAEASGIILTCFTTQPGVQFYTGNFLTERPGKDGGMIGRRSGFCLETQHFPNAMRHTHFPSIVIGPDCPLTSQTVFGFVDADRHRELQALLREETTD